MDDGWFDRQAACGPSDEETRYGLTALGQAALFSYAAAAAYEAGTAEIRAE